MLSAACLALLIVTFTERAERARALAYWGAAAASGEAIGTLLGGVLTELFTWRAVLLVNVPVGAVMIAVAAPALPDGRDRTAGGLDLSGGLSATVGTAAFA